MGKYIDEEKLIAEIERRRKICADIAADERNKEVAEYYRGKKVAHEELSSFVTSLQQERPEVDLEKEIDACWQNWVSPSNQKEVEGVLPKIEFATYARHFFELGKTQRKE